MDTKACTCYPLHHRASQLSDKCAGFTSGRPFAIVSEMSVTVAALGAHGANRAPVDTIRWTFSYEDDLVTRTDFTLNSTDKKRTGESENEYTVCNMLPVVARDDAARPTLTPAHGARSTPPRHDVNSLRTRTQHGSRHTPTVADVAACGRCRPERMTVRESRRRSRRCVGGGELSVIQ